MNFNDYTPMLNERGALEFIASMLAPTEDQKSSST